MYVFFDESGDCGFRFNRGSSNLFVVTMVVFKTEEEARKASDLVDRLRSRLGKSSQFEFHFSKNCDSIRESFLRGIAILEFDVFCLVLDKSRLIELASLSADEFYQQSCELLFDQTKGTLCNATITLDACGGREFLASVRTCLKRKLNSPDNDFVSAGKRIRKVVAAKSSGNNLLQVADMICGAVVRAQSKSDEKWYRIIQSHVMGLTCHPNRAL